METRWARWPFAIAIPVLMLAWVAVRNVEEDRPHVGAPFRALHGVETDADRQALSSLLDQSYATLRSPELEANLRVLAPRYPTVFANTRQQSVGLLEVGDLLALRRPGSRYVQTDVWLVPGEMGAALGYLGMASEHSAGEGRYSDIELVRPLLDAWRSPDPVMRSCAVNVAAHEYAHTLSTTPFVYRTAFTDTSAGEERIAGRSDRSTPVASYLLGSLAQCTWLQQQGRIDRADVARCVEAFGVGSGNPQRCRSFADGQPISPRADLPPLNNPL